LYDNRAFAGWVVFVVGGAAILFASLVLTGVAVMPPLATFVKDVAMGLGIRAAYKQVGGWDWAEWAWSFAGDAPEAIASVVPLRAAQEELAKAA